MEYSDFRAFVRTTAMDEAYEDVDDTRVGEMLLRISFNQSNMFVINPTKTPKHETLSFSDFLEAFARMANACAWDGDERPLILKCTEVWDAFFAPLLHLM